MRPAGAAAALAALLALAGAAPAQAACEAGATPRGIVLFEGSIDGRLAAMTLAFEGRRARGRYFYGRTPVDVPVEGELQGGGALALVQKDARGAVRARFALFFPDTDPDDGRALDPCSFVMGTWSIKDDRDVYPVQFAREAELPGASPGHQYAAAGAEETVVDRAALAFWLAVKADDRARVAAALRYPIEVAIDGRRQSLAAPKDFLDRYDRILTPPWREALLHRIPHGMFANARGVMLGQGEAWFDAGGKVIALNPVADWDERSEVLWLRKHGMLASDPAPQQEAVTGR